MRFPSLFEFLVNGSGPALVSGSGLLILAFYMLWRWWARQREDESKEGYGAHLGMCVILLIIGVGHFFAGCVALKNTLSWRAVEPSRVSEMEVWVVSDEINDSTDGSPVVLRDPERILQAFETLNGAKTWHPEHEHLEDGYRIRFKVNGHDSDEVFYLSAYRRSSRGYAVSVVVPHVGPSVVPGLVLHGDEYWCPEFHQWLEENVDPLFAADGEADQAPQAK
jgi:hypothetical protein